MLGTLINVFTVLLGGGLGTVVGARLPERIRDTVMAGLGLMTIVVGLQLALKTANVLVVLVSVLVGAILGEWWRLDERLARFSEWLKARVARQVRAERLAHFSEGFITASLVFCVGPMTVLGSIQDGLTGDYTLLALKSVLDGFAALAFASSLGVGVLFSVLTIVVIQGGLSLSAGLVGPLVNDVLLNEMTATGGVLMLGIGLLLLDLKRIRVANLLPALLVVLGLVSALQALGVAGY